MNKLFFVFIFGSVLTGLYAAGERLIDAFVDIQTKVVNGDLIKAREVAEKLAFEEAVKQATMNTFPEEKTKEFVKDSLHYVKTYQKLGERQEGDILFVKYRVEVISPVVEAATKVDESTPSPSSGEVVKSRPVQFEILLNSKISPPLSSSALIQFVKDTWRLSVNDLRLSRGIIRFQVALDRPLSEAEAQIVKWLGERGSVKSSEVAVAPSTPNDVMPAQPPTAQPSDNPNFKPEVHSAPPLIEPTPSTVPPPVTEPSVTSEPIPSLDLQPVPPPREP